MKPPDLSDGGWLLDDRDEVAVVCPCGNIFGASRPEGEAKEPSVGDGIVCLSCGTVLIFLADGLLRKATDQDLKPLSPSERDRLDHWLRVSRGN